MYKRGEILIESIVFIILNLAFLTILVLFLLKQGTGAILLEDSYAKQIALLVDSAEPGTIMEINMKRGLDLSEEKGVDFKEAVSFSENYVKVKLSEKGGFEYPLFNDVQGEAFPETEEGEYTGMYKLTVSRK